VLGSLDLELFNHRDTETLRKKLSASVTLWFDHGAGPALDAAAVGVSRPARIALHEPPPAIADVRRGDRRGPIAV